ncbi:MAG: uroporphyrinogen decarboxylase family protein [Candidatus Latescibacterota bacterium]
MTEKQGDRTHTLTHRERFCRLYDFEKVDRPTRWEAVGFWGQTVSEWKAAGGLPEDGDAMAHYGFDPCPTVSGGLGLTEMALSGPSVQSRVIKDEGHTQVWENDLGKSWRERTDGTSMPQWLRFPVQSHRDWLTKIKPRLDPKDHDYGDLEATASQQQGNDAPNGLWLVGLYAFWRNFWGEENLAYAFYDAPETLHDMARTWLTMHGECLPAVFEVTRPDYTLFHEDMAFKNGPLIGPDLFDRFMAPYYRELFAHLRQHGQHRFMLDSDGNNGAVLERFIALGINGLFPFEVAAGNDVLAFRKTHPEFFIWGGIDKRVLLRTKEEIKREVMEKVPVLWESGGYIPSLDHSVPPCLQENFEVFLELTRSLFG